MALAALTAAALTLVTASPAAAGFFERLFGGFHHRAPSPPFDLFGSFLRGSEPPRGESAPASGYCVRTSDGFYFPVHASAGTSAAAICRALCPASPTKLYSGGGIDNAVAADGSRYADLATAFLYRQHLVAGSTCNGRNQFGLAHIDVAGDPTLRPGDIVTTPSGFVAVGGTESGVASFTPIDRDRAVPSDVRLKLSNTKITPSRTVLNAASVQSAVGERGDSSRSAQLSR